MPPARGLDRIGRHARRGRHAPSAARADPWGRSPPDDAGDGGRSRLVRPLTPMPFYGLKSPRLPGSVGRWLIEHLPLTTGYAEVFAGMAGVLLNRPQSKREIVNDRDGRISHWWRAVRDEPDALEHLCANSPPDRRAFEEAKAVLETEPPAEGVSVRQAWAFWLVCRDSVIHGSNGRGNFAHYWTPEGGRKRFPHISALSERMREVVVESRDAVEILERLARYDGWTVFADPPYRSADTTPYRAEVDDIEALTAALEAQRGPVAVSGYNDDWAHLAGFKVMDFPALFVNSEGARSPRTERLWFRGFDPQPTLGLVPKGTTT